MALIEEYSYKGRILEAPQPGMSAVQVRDYWAQTYPELTNAVIVYPEHDKDGIMTYEFTTPQGPATEGRVAKAEFKTSIGRKG